MASLEAGVAEFIARNRLLDPAESAPVIVALSGGADSMCLLAVLTALGYECVAAHCNFGLRGAESDRDMRHAASVAAKLGADFCYTAFDVAARRRADGSSTEMACRDLRYEWFADLASHLHAQAVAVGHHREDQAETVVLNALRGSGLAGLCGMHPRHGMVVRPLLECSRTEIEQYLAERQLNYVTDSSNLDAAHYRRNRVRLEVLPALDKACLPGQRAADALAMTATNLQRQNALYRHMLQMAAAPYINGDASIRLKALADELPLDAEQTATLLFELIKDRGYNYAQARSMLRALSSGSTTYPDGHGHTSTLSRGVLTFGAMQQTESQPDCHAVNPARGDILTPVHITVSRHPARQFVATADPAVAMFDEAIFAGEPEFALRHWQAGDRMTPFGMQGTKKLSDMFADAGLTAAQKRRIWLLTRNGDIVWAVGLRAAEGWRVTPRTRRFVMLRLRSNLEPQGSEQL